MPPETTSTQTSHLSQSPMNASTFVPHLFTTPVSLKLTEDNFLVWKQQILATIQGLEFLHFLEGDNIPSQFSIDTHSATQTLNPHFLHHQRQDHLLVAWLLASILPQCSTKWWPYHSCSDLEEIEYILCKSFESQSQEAQIAT